MRILTVLILTSLFLAAGCKQSDKPGAETNGTKMSAISEKTMESVINALVKEHGESNKFRIERGVKQTASFWKAEDGSEQEFEKFCAENFIADSVRLDRFFTKISTNYESIFGHFDKLYVDLNRQLHLEQGEIEPIDLLFGAFDTYAHLTDDMFKNKIAFHILLNFPHYSLDEKHELGAKWTRMEWAYARMGDIFSARVPAEVSQRITTAFTASDNYISEYNILAGYLLNEKGETLFPEDMKLITHWNLRDELKSQYAKEGGLERQKMLYEVMKRIISQEIPKDVINSNKYNWNPFTNKVTEKGAEVKAEPEPDTRYQMLLNNYLALRTADPFSPYYPTYIERKFNKEMEMTQEQVEALFVKLVSSPVIKSIGELISKRLNRGLEPFDIWYDGFKARSAISQDELDKKTKSKYPNSDAFAKDMPNILQKLGFSKEKANEISSKIVVEGSRGAGHAIGARMKSEKAHLRTRIGADGMNYKGYNIAVHEFGHNVEQTITLQDVDYYMLAGVPNTAFTEAWAFLFQKRDLELLGIKDNTPNKDHLYALDNIWATYEIMGVSLVDMRVWKWLYANPNAKAADLKKAVIDIAIDVWNSYYAPVFGIKDQPILAIYSHMIDYPLYLSAYPLGHLIEFQIESYSAGKNLGAEMQRILTQGSVTPKAWMLGAVGEEISVDPLIKAAENALLFIKE